MKRSLAACCYFSLALLLVSCGGGGGGFFLPPSGSSPTVNATTPSNGATAIPITITVISATFDRAMDGTTVTGTTFVVKDSANQTVPGTVSLSGATATFAPSSVLAASTLYTATITTGAKDMAGTPLAGNFAWSFTTTSDATRPTVISTVPANAATGVAATTAALTINFSEAMDPASITPATITVNGQRRQSARRNDFRRNAHFGNIYPGGLPGLQHHLYDNGHHRSQEPGRQHHGRHIHRDLRHTPRVRFVAPDGHHRRSAHERPRGRLDRHGNDRL